MVKKITSLRVKQSMWSMLLGRPLSAVGGFVVLVLLSRHLSSDDYGQYFSVWALAEIVILASNCGLIHAVYRYISADETLSGKLLPAGPVWQLVAWRVISLLPAAALLPLFPGVAGLLGASVVVPSTALALAFIIAGEGMARFLESIFDSMLCQGRSQITLLSRTLARLVGYIYFMSHGELGLSQVLLVESVATIGGAVLGLGLLLALWHRAEHVTVTETHWRHMVGFALPAYVAQVLTLTYGPDALKLILAAVAGPSELALFGFAFSLAAVVQRYIPVNLLAGVFRPIFVSAAKRPDAEQVLSSLLALSVKISWLMILPIFCALWSGGSGALSAISGGNYPQAGAVVTVVVAGLLMIAMHLTLSMYCLAIGISWPMLGATVASVSCLPLALWLSGSYGALGIAGVFVVSELLWSLVCFYLLRRLSGGQLSLDWLGFMRLLVAAVGAVSLGHLLKFTGLHWLAISGLSACSCLFFSWLASPFSARELGWLASVLPGGERLLARLTAMRLTK